MTLAHRAHQSILLVNKKSVIRWCDLILHTKLKNKIAVCYKNIALFALNTILTVLTIFTLTK